MIHKLPELPYSYDALEPYIDQETMRLHHDNHHKSYIDKLNKALKDYPQISKLFIGGSCNELEKIT